MKDCKIPESVERILDSYGVTATIEEDYIEVEGRTEHDGDMIHSLYVKQDEFNDLYAWYKAWHDMCEGFDPWYETSLWCENGVPVRTPFDKANDLYNDINDYKSGILEGIDNDLYALVNGNNREKENTMAKFYIDFVLPVSACRVIKARTRDEAEAIAKKMIDDDEYWEGIIDSIENDYDCWRSKYCKVEVIGDAPSDMEADNE